MANTVPADEPEALPDLKNSSIWYLMNIAYKNGWDEIARDCSDELLVRNG